MKWEYFHDISYYDMWAVRPEGDQDLNSSMLFHVSSKNEAERLAMLLNAFEELREEVSLFNLQYGVSQEV